MIKFILIALALPSIAGCGYSYRDSEMSGQVKRVMRATPIICPDRYDVDISLGIVRGGSGSMSSHDVEATIVDDQALRVLKEAAETGKLVKVTYNVARFSFCPDERQVTKAEFIP